MTLMMTSTSCGLELGGRPSSPANPLPSYVSAAGLLLRLPFRLSFTQRHLPGEPAAAAATRKRTPK